MATVQLANLDAKLTYLALQYHLARPGSELDPDTGGPSTRGLAAVAHVLEPQLEQAVATIGLSEQQRQRLLSAMSGTMNELKTYPLLPERSGGRRSAIPGFDVVLRRLFPEIETEPDETSQLAGHLMAARRRLASAEATRGGEGAGAAPRRWWRFWQRQDA